MTTHKNIYMALASAQAEMGTVVKGAVNPQFKSKYADLSDVMSVALPPLNKNGIAVWQCIVLADGVNMMRTTLSHGESDTHISCDVPLIVDKSNMQGMKSATTYARRIGIESMAGIAPEDDDGNAAAKAAPVVEDRRQEQRKPSLIGADQYLAIKARVEEAGVDESKICTAFKVDDLQFLTVDDFMSAMKRLQATIDAKPKPNADIGEDGIPY